MAFQLLPPSKHDIYPFIDPRGVLQGAANGKIVLVTGAGSGGLGGKIAESFALAGASEIIIAARRTEPLEETKKGILELISDCAVTVFGGIDISKEESVKKLFDGLASAPDILVSCAAVSPDTATVAESDPANWFLGVDINIKGSYLMARAYINSALAAGKEGCLINISSNASWRCISGRSAYAATKVAMNNMTEYIDLEGEANGIRCIALHPGGVITEMSSTNIEKLPEKIRQILIDTPALSGGTAVYLSTERAKFLGGRFVLATWDMEELEKHKERIEREDLLKTRVVGVTD